jgi:uncharacterized protein (DUF1501 family)
MKRRELLKALAAIPLATTATTLFAAPAGNPRLLLVFLRGGYDAANLLVPVSSDFYYASRPNIAIARPSNDPNSALPLTSEWGLHPALRESIHPLYVNGQAAFIPFAGTDDTSRSHFETQDSIEMGQPEGSKRDFQSGFLNRLAATLNGVGTMSFTDRLPLAMQGKAPVVNMALRNAGKQAIDIRQSNIIAAMYQGTRLAQTVSEGFAVRDEVARDMAGEMEAANRNAISAKGFETEARRIARLMKEKYRIGFVDVGGWDTHVGEGGANGYLANRLDELGRGLAAFSQELGPAWRDSVVVVISEFGRTFRENGNKGTDHGHGTVYWVLGGSINGGHILGEQVRVDAGTLFQQRDYPVLNEYRAVLGGLFARMYGLTRTQLAQVFAGANPKDIGIV